MKLQFKQIEPFVKAPSAEALAILVYGPDEGLIRERAQTMAKTVVSDLNDPFNVTEMSGDQLAESPSRLIDEAQSISMLGGRKVIRVRVASDKNTAVIKETLTTLGKDANLIIVEAGELGPRSTLRLLFESAPNAAAVPCYVDDARDIGRILQDGLKEKGLSISSDALSYMAANVVGDRGVARSEIEKISIYMGGQRQIGLEDVTACIGNSDGLSIDMLCKAAASGEFTDAARVLKNLLSEGMPPVTVLRSLQNYFFRIYVTKARTDKGENIEIAMKKLKPEVFWKNKASFESQVRSLSMINILQALSLLASAEARCKQTGAVPEIQAERAIMALCQMTGRAFSVASRNRPY